MATTNLNRNNPLILGCLFMFISSAIGWDYVSRCPSHIRRDDYLKAFKEKCYSFHYSELYWNDALSWCRRQGGTLVEIRNKQIQDFIMQSLHQLGWRRNGVWIGAHDRIHESYWEWASGGHLTWNNWAGDQHGCCFGMLEDCAVLRFRDHGVWHDYPCKHIFYKYSYICEYDKSPRPTNATVTTTTSTTTTTTTTPTPSTTTSTSALYNDQAGKVGGENHAGSDYNNPTKVVRGSNHDGDQGRDSEGNLLQEGQNPMSQRLQKNPPMTVTKLYSSHSSVAASVTGLLVFILMSLCIIGFLAIRRRRSRKSNRPGIPRVTEKSVVFNKLRCESMRNGSTSFPMCGSSHMGHHFSDDTEHAYSSDNEVIYEEIDNKIVRFPEKEDLMVKLVPQNIYVNNNNNPGISGMANGAANDQKRRHSLPNDIYTTAGPSTHNPHYQEV